MHWPGRSHTCARPPTISANSTYRRPGPGKRLFLKFYGVESVAHLFVNGTYVGEHRGGTTAFVFEITDRVKYGSENLLRVAVSNAITGDVLPLSSIHNIYGGISREVELIVTDSTAVSPLYLGSSGVLIHPRAVSTERPKPRPKSTSSRKATTSAA